MWIFVFSTWVELQTELDSHFLLREQRSISISIINVVIGVLTEGSALCPSLPTHYNELVGSALGGTKDFGAGNR